jgi:hypothetical protein
MVWQTDCRVEKDQMADYIHSEEARSIKKKMKIYASA